MAQQIYFPKAGDEAREPKEIGPYLNQYAGQQLTTGGLRRPLHRRALYGAIASFAGAALMLVLSLLGLAHLRRVPDTREVLPGKRVASPATA